MADFSFAHTGANTKISYAGNSGTATASVRTSKLSYNYGVTSTESQSRNQRGFYPHRRAQGQFSMTVDCKGYTEFKQLMKFFANYKLVLDGQFNSSGLPVTMTVSCPVRNFTRVGIPTSGMDDHDQTGSMVFSPELVFVSVADPKDKVTTQLTKTNQLSRFTAPEHAPSGQKDFYPSSTLSLKDQALYDDLSALNAVGASVLGIIYSQSNPDALNAVGTAQFGQDNK
jgi:hypothetical protein